jgi:hypothetical protein
MQRTPRSPLAGEHALVFERGEGSAANTPVEAAPKVTHPSPFPPCDSPGLAGKIAAESPLPQGERARS